MSYFTWKESGLTKDCTSLESMASRFEESAKLMRKMSEDGFELKIENNNQIIIHSDSEVFKNWGFISEESPYRQLKLMS
tara:strand:+ start:36 stop:272 length:237 start_codon:yes stop_codon:yes gene_type:complete